MSTVRSGVIASGGRNIADFNWHFYADADHNLTTSGSNVVSIGSLIGGGTFNRQSTGPTINTAWRNSKNAFTCSTFATRMVGTGGNIGTNTNAPFTTVNVGQLCTTPAVAPYAIPCAWIANPGNSWFQNNTVNYYGDDATYNFGAITAGQKGTPFISICYNNGASSNLKIWFNGLAKKDSNSAGGGYPTTSNTGTSGWTWGSGRTDYPYSSQLAAFGVIPGQLTTAQENDLFGILSGYYNIIPT